MAVYWYVNGVVKGDHDPIYEKAQAELARASTPEDASQADASKANAKGSTFE